MKIDLSIEQLKSSVPVKGRFEIVWIGEIYQSREHCVLNFNEHEIQVNSDISGINAGELFEARYTLVLNRNWETLRFDLSVKYQNKSNAYSLEALPDLNWKWNGRENNSFRGCTEVDLPLTPLTNSLPIHRLKLKKHEQALINVIYLDVFGSGVHPLQQQYRRIYRNQYHYQNVPNDFEAVITVDDYGLVEFYPGIIQQKIF